MNVKKQRRSRRPGAGRPLMDKRLKGMVNSIRLPAWLTDWLNEREETKTLLIADALIAHYKLEPHKSAGKPEKKR